MSKETRRKMGKPPEQKMLDVHLRIYGTLAERLEKLAQTERRPWSNLITLLLEKALANDKDATNG